MKTVIYANCQADGIKLFLHRMGFPFEITVFRNYQMILGEQKIEDLEREAKDCDLFIYQPTNDKHGDSSSENILATLKTTTQTISFAYFYNHGLHPLTEQGTKFPGIEFIPREVWDLPIYEIMRQYDDQEFDFHLWERYLFCLQEQATRESKCDLKLTRWMNENQSTRLLLNVNHPTSKVFIELARQIMERLELAIRPVGDVPENLTGLPCTLPFAAEVANVFGIKRTPDPEARTYYRNLLRQCWLTYSQPVATSEWNDDAADLSR
jgi:hypothetical protein